MNKVICLFHHIFRPAIAESPPTAVPAAHSSQWLARAGGVPSVLYCGVRVGIHGWPLPRRNLWGPANPFILQFGERHSTDSGGDVHVLLLLNLNETISTHDSVMTFFSLSIQTLILEIQANLERLQKHVFETFEVDRQLFIVVPICTQPAGYELDCHTYTHSE